MTTAQRRAKSKSGPVRKCACGRETRQQGECLVCRQERIAHFTRDPEPPSRIDRARKILWDAIGGKRK